MIEKITTGSFFTNSYVISNDKNECIIVDPGMNYEKTANYIKDKYDVKAILITHGHIDHIDGVRFFDVPVYMSRPEEKVFFSSNNSLYSMMSLNNPYQKREMNVVFLDDLEEFDLIGIHFKMLLTPGHTVGSCCYSYKNKVLTGDTLFRGSCGRTDFPTGDSKAMLKSLSRIIEFYPDNDDVYPGHDEKTTIKIERQNNMYIKK